MIWLKVMEKHFCNESNAQIEQLFCTADYVTKNNLSFLK